MFPRRHLFIAVCVGLAFLPFASAESSTTTARALYSPAPKYPAAARAKGLEGKGLFRLVLNQDTGEVLRVEILKSTGHNILDQAATEAYRRWRFKPGQFTAVEIPTNFSRDGSDSVEIDGVSPQAFASKRLSVEDDATKAEVFPIEHPAPEYPMWARARLVTGSGRFRLMVDFETGAVTRVVSVRSTGSEKLDAEGIKVFKRWRFSPRTTRSVTVPLTFTIEGGPFSKELEVARKFAIFSPTPSYPTAARFSYLQSWGTYQFIIDFATGRVTDVKIIMTSGSAILDRSITKTFRTWRFQPHTVRSVTTNFGFMFDRKGRGNAGF